MLFSVLLAGIQTLVALGVTGVILVIASQFVCVIPPRSLTHGAMHMIKRRVIRYVGMHGSVPSGLDVLPRIEGYHDGITDGWGHPILYEVDSGRVVLRSLGSDHEPGGNGEGIDMVGEFSIWTPDGALQDELADWTRDPFDSR